MLFLILTALCGAVTLITSVIAIYDRLRQFPRPEQAKYAFGTAIATLFLTIIFLLASIPSLTGNAIPTASSTPTITPGHTVGITPSITSTSAPPTVIPSPTPTPTPSPCNPKSGTVLYQADWSQGLNNWLVTGGDWTVSNHMLETAGNGNLILAPDYPGDTCISDYVVAANITLIRRPSSTEDDFGLVARATTDGKGYTLSICAKYKYAFGTCVGSCDDNNDCQYEYAALLLTGQQFPDGGAIVKTVFQPSEQIQITYRLMVQGDTITAFENGHRLLGPIQDNTYPSGGQVGIWSINSQLNVSSFEVVAL